MTPPTPQRRPASPCPARPPVPPLPVAPSARFLRAHACHFGRPRSLPTSPTLPLLRCQALRNRVAARGEAYTGHVNRSDFVAALSVLASKLALDVDEPQIEQLFDTVAAGAASVHFGDFVGADSTRRFFDHLVGEASRSTDQSLYEA